MADDSSFIVSSHHQDEWHRTVSHGIGCGSARGGTDEGGGATGSHLYGRLGPRPEALVAADASVAPDTAIASPPSRDLPHGYHGWSRDQKKKWRNKHPRK